MSEPIDVLVRYVRTVERIHAALKAVTIAVGSVGDVNAVAPEVGPELVAMIEHLEQAFAAGERASKAADAFAEVTLERIEKDL